MLDLFTWARGWPFAHIVEFGVCHGMSTISFLAALETDRKGCLWSVDIGDPLVPLEWHESRHWQFLKAHDLSSRVQDWLPADIDVLFIDAEHDYGSCKAELDMYVPRVRPGGVVLCHDTDPVETSGPAGALDAYCAEHPGLEWRNKAGCQGLGIMRIR